jgi:hypothetical protein
MVILIGFLAPDDSIGLAREFLERKLALIE